MLALSLTLFCVTTLAATLAAHQIGRNTTNAAQLAPDEREIALPSASRFFAQYRAN